MAKKPASISVEPAEWNSVRKAAAERDMTISGYVLAAHKHYSAPMADQLASLMKDVPEGPDAQSIKALLILAMHRLVTGSPLDPSAIPAHSDDQEGQP